MKGESYCLPLLERIGFVRYGRGRGRYALLSFLCCSCRLDNPLQTLDIVLCRLLVLKSTVMLQLGMTLPQLLSLRLSSTNFLVDVKFMN